jgi:PEP-CTERM motif
MPPPLEPRSGSAGSSTSRRGSYPRPRSARRRPGNSIQSLLDLSPQPLITGGSATANASSNVDGLAGNRTASGDATIGDLGLDLTILLTQVLVINSGEIFSSASVTGDHGALSSTGTTTFGNTSITVNSATFFLDPMYAPNTVVYNQGGITIIANEQIYGGDGIALEEITVNALRISLGVLGVTGDIVLGQSQAALTAVPEPSAALMLGLGLAALARYGRRSR